MTTEQPPILTADEDAALDRAADQAGPGYYVGWQARLDNVSLEHAPTQDDDNWIRGWKKCDSLTPRPITIDVDGDGKTIATIQNRKWTATDPVLAALLKTRAASLGPLSDADLATDAKVFLATGGAE